MQIVTWAAAPRDAAGQAGARPRGSYWKPTHILNGGSALEDGRSVACGVVNLTLCRLCVLGYRGLI